LDLENDLLKKENCLSFYFNLRSF